MKRIVLCIITLVLVTGIGLVAAPVSGAPNQAVPTNTKRPTITLPPPTPTASTLTDTPADTATIPPTITPTATNTVAIGPNTYPDNINSLTGLPFPSEAARNRRNLIVKVSNFPWIVRPQSGLSKADVVYEYEVEGGVTRFAAIYRSQGADYVGSIRSARLLDLELVTMYQGLLAYSGANDNIKKMIGTASWKYQAMTPQFGDNCPPFCRYPKPGLPFEHTLFGNTFQMWDLATKRNVNQGLPGKGFAFAETPDPGGDVANDIALKWYGDQDARWQYNPGDGKYYRWNTGLPHIDAATGQQLTADNVIVLEAYHKKRPDIYESETGSPAIEVQLWGEEKAWVFRDGQWYKGIWRRSNREKNGVALSLFTPDGKTPIHLKPGVTWVEIVRCCDMYGTKVSTTYEDVDATASIAAITATFRGPRAPADANQATKQSEVAAMTSTVSAATAQLKKSTPNAPLTPTSAPKNSSTVGLLIPDSNNEIYPPIN